MGKWSARALAGVAGLWLWGCAHRGPIASMAEAQGPFRLGREDVVEVAVWRDADLSRTVPVRPDGFISLPLAGEFRAEGKTTAELAEEIKAKLAPYIQDPKVTVAVHEVNSTRMYVTGEVARPGGYPLRGRVSVLQAIALAGGFTAFANPDNILIIRKGSDGGRIPVRYTELLETREDGSSADFLLWPGDTVVVP